MEETLNIALSKITKGAGKVFIGSLLGVLLTFIGRLAVARYGTESEYGIFSLALVILTVCSLIATLGLQNGASRSIAYNRARNENEKVSAIVSSSIWLVLMTGLTLGVIIFCTSGLISNSIFHEPRLAFPLQILAAAVVFFALTNVLASIFLGFERVEPRIYFQNILLNASFLGFLGLVIAFDIPFKGVFGAYLTAVGLTCLLFSIYFLKRSPSPAKFIPKPSFNVTTKELLLFSLPLLGVGILDIIMLWTDTLMLGYFQSLASVGLYNAAVPIAQFVSMPIGVIMVIYIPVISGLYGQGLIADIRRNFSLVTKWVCSATLPLFLTAFLFPAMVLSLLFGGEYAIAANALRILSLGAIIASFLGPVGATLIALGHSRFMLRVTSLTAALNICLNIVLIPQMGIEGAAIATVTATICGQLIRCWKLYSVSHALPFSKNLLKPLVSSLAVVFLLYFISQNFLDATYWMLPLLFILYCIIYGLAVLSTKSFDKEDIALLLAIEKRANVNATFAKKILRRFL